MQRFKPRKFIFYGLLIGLALVVWYVPAVRIQLLYLRSRIHLAIYFLADYLGPVIGWIIGWTVALWMMPGIIIVTGPWIWLFGPDSLPASSIVRVPAIALMGLISHVFWSNVIPRFGHLLGLWNPFFNIHSSRPFFFATWVKLSEWWEIVRKFGRGPTGGWASLIEVLSYRYKVGDIFLGRPKLPFHIGGLMRPIGLSTDRHMVTISQTGGGKSTSALIPNICIHGSRKGGSLLCIDPKGELATITAARRGSGGGGVKGMGQAVFVLDPFHIVKGWNSASYNPFDEMAHIAESDVDRPVSYAGKIADALIKKQGEREVYWDNAAHTFLRGLILYAFQGPQEHRNLVQVRKLIMQGDVESHEKLLADGTIRRDQGLSPFDTLLLNMKECPPGPYHDAIAGAAGSLLMMGRNQFGSVVTTAQEHTAFLDTPEIRKVSLKSDFLLDDLKKNPTSIYLCVPINAVSGKEGRWLRMFILLFIDMMMRTGTAKGPPVLLAIDEFPSLGHLEGIEVVAPVMRSYGVRFWAIGQDIEQFQKTYPESWGGFIGGAEAVQFLGITHPATVEMIVKLLGQHGCHRRTRSGASSARFMTCSTRTRFHACCRRSGGTRSSGAAANGRCCSRRRPTGGICRGGFTRGTRATAKSSGAGYGAGRNTAGAGRGIP